MILKLENIIFKDINLYTIFYLIFARFLYINKYIYDKVKNYLSL